MRWRKRDLGLRSKIIRRLWSILCSWFEDYFNSYSLQEFILFHDSLYILLLLFDNQAHDLHHNTDHLSHCSNKLKNMWKTPKLLSTWKWSNTQLKFFHRNEISQTKIASYIILTRSPKDKFYPPYQKDDDAWWNTLKTI